MLRAKNLPQWLSFIWKRRVSCTSNLILPIVRSPLLGVSTQFSCFKISDSKVPFLLSFFFFLSQVISWFLGPVIYAPLTSPHRFSFCWGSVHLHCTSRGLIFVTSFLGFSPVFPPLVLFFYMFIPKFLLSPYTIFIDSHPQLFCPFPSHWVRSSGVCSCPWVWSNRSVPFVTCKFLHLVQHQWLHRLQFYLEEIKQDLSSTGLHIWLHQRKVWTHKSIWIQLWSTYF